MKSSNFRNWLQEIWMQHKDELEIWTKSSPEYDIQHYFEKHKWWLKLQFKKRLTSNDK
jgi:hypothetical protein